MKRKINKEDQRIDSKKMHQEKEPTDHILLQFEIFTPITFYLVGEQEIYKGDKE